jgi:molybdopterin-containing oxidoreductase family iron-sulfur binding subunit
LNRKGLDIGQVRERLRDARGPSYWRSLEEVAAHPEFEEFLHREFPRQASEWVPAAPAADAALPTSRRGFLQLASASLGLAGLTACTRQPLEKIVPYVQQPEEFVPGKPLFYATAFEHGGYGTGVLVESHAGRPTKIEGNPDHPASQGATDLFAQASILGMYDPDRSQVVTNLAQVATWDRFVLEVGKQIEAQKALGGAGIRMLTETITSPTVGAQLAAITTALPQARWHQWEPASRHGARAAAAQVLGGPAEVRYDFSLADVVVTLDADPLVSGPGAVRYARDFAARRRVYEAGTTMNRLYAVESTPTGTGTQADHRLALAPAEVARFALALAAAVGVAEAAGAPAVEGRAKSFVDAIAADLAAHPGKSLVVAGDHASAALHALALAINDRLGNLGTTVLVSDPVETAPVDQLASLRGLVDDMRAGKVEMLFILGGNPIYDAPADLDFKAALERVPTRIHLGLYADETAEYCHWHVNQTHYLEAWGDTRAYDGTVTLQQPLIEPLYGGKSLSEVLSLFSGAPAAGEELLKAHWLGAGAPGAIANEKAWRRILHDGVVPGTALPHRGGALAAGAVATATSALQGEAAATGIAVLLRPDPSLHDGRWANNGWLQELPKPLTKLTWDNAVLVAPATAERLGIDSEDLVEVSHGSRKVTLPVWVLPGQADNAVTVHLGFGRWRGGKVANGVGSNTYALRTSDALWTLAGASLTKVDGHYALASTQHHHMLETNNLEGHEAEKRELIQTATLADFTGHRVTIKEKGEEAAKEATEAQLFPDWEYPADQHAWGMSIDLSSCTGCNACVIACQSENNIPVVGKEQVTRGREMQWLRIDRYYYGEDLDDPALHNQPLLCMQCERAPCEVVCPVAATVHSAEGLNDMVYNRCVGTRYCSNNCPYKVRRFNFLRFNDYDTPVLELMRNPDVTVRSRGVMEKCTYCVQRINWARIEAKKQNRLVRDGEIVTACQQVCPSEAIVFGNINDHESRVAKRKEQVHDYSLLVELDTRPRTTYLAKLRNPNPALETA